MTHVAIRLAGASALTMLAVTLSAAQRPEAPHKPRTAASTPWDGSEAYYTSTQAERGAAAYKQHCVKCHADGYRNHARMKFEGKTAYPSVYYLFKRMEDQPPDTKAISQRTRADVVAYMLQTSGFPAGGDELL